MRVSVEACNVQWRVEVEVLRGPDDMEDVEECDFTVSPTMWNDGGVTLSITPQTPTPVRDLHVLVIVIAQQDGDELFRVAGWVASNTHNTGPYDVFQTEAMVKMKTEDAIADMWCYYTPGFPRMWTRTKVSIHSSQLAKLVP
jgi:hypothetical protein